MRAMKLVLCGLVALFAFGGVALAASPAQSLTGALDGAPHDFRSEYGIAANGEICKPCHTPHHAPYWDLGPIWNHKPSDVLSVDGGSLTGSSKLCMGCHDGVTAVDAYGYDPATGLPKTTGSYFIDDVRGPNLGTNMHDDHPVSIDYPTDSHTLEAPATVADYLEEGRVECGSCHRAHGFGSDTLTSPARYILRVTRANSELCRVCHTF